LFDPEDFLFLAKRLIEESDDEATLRTVISRAYYGAFLALRSSMNAKGATHKNFWTSVQALDPALGEVGQRLRLPRNSADYGDSMPNLLVDSRVAIGRAELILERCR